MANGGDKSASYNADQAGGQGVLGQGLAAQQQALGAGLLGGGAGAPGGDPGAPPAPIGPPPKIRQGFTLLDPKDWTPEEHALYRAQHNIQAPPTLLDQIRAALGASTPAKAR